MWNLALLAVFGVFVCVRVVGVVSYNHVCIIIFLTLGEIDVGQGGWQLSAH